MSDLEGLHHAANKISRDEWHAAILASADDPSVCLSDASLPGFPEKEVQLRVNGRPARQSLHQAFDLYCTAMDAFQRLNVPVDPTLLDFGAGWGRVWRYFLRDFAPSRCLAYDVNPRLLSFWRREIGVEPAIGKAYEVLPIATASVDLVVSNSVFSHLSRQLNAFSIGELARILRPGGLFVGTTFGRWSIEKWSRFAEVEDEALLPLQRAYARMTDDWRSVIGAYDRGEFVWMEPERSTTLVDYEVAAFNGDWIVNNWTEFELIQFDDARAGQPIFVVLKT